MGEGVVKNPGQGEQIKNRVIWWILHKKSLLCFLFLIFETAEIPLVLNERQEARGQSQHALHSEPAVTKQRDWQWDCEPAIPKLRNWRFRAAAGSTADPCLW